MGDEFERKQDALHAAGDPRAMGAMAQIACVRDQLEELDRSARAGQVRVVARLDRDRASPGDRDAGAMGVGDGESEPGRIGPAVPHTGVHATMALLAIGMTVGCLAENSHVCWSTTWMRSFPPKKSGRPAAGPLDPRPDPRP